MVKYTSTILAAANVLALVHAAPAQPVCKEVTETFTGRPTWVPQAEASSAAWTAWDPKEPKDKTTTSASAWSTWDPKKPEDETTSSTVWSTWDPKKPEDKTTSASASWSTWDPKKPEDKTTTSATWGTWDPKEPKDKTTSSVSWTWDPKEPKDKTTTAAPSWSTWSSEDPKTPKDKTTASETSLFWGEWTSSKTVTSGGGFYPQPTETITKKPEETKTTEHAKPTDETTKETKTAKETKTTEKPAPAVTTCAANDHSVLDQKPSGSCECEFSTHCNALSSPGDDAIFWERKQNELFDSLQACLEVCNENSACQAAIWTDSKDAPSRDYKHCYQVINLPQPGNQGYGQLSYKGACSGQCSKNYQTYGGA